MSVLSRRLRRAALEAELDRAVERALGEGEVDRLDAARSPEDDRERARAIPIIGPMSGGGAIPGTVPHRQRRLDRLERALKRGSAGTVHGDGHRGRG